MFVPDIINGALGFDSSGNLQADFVNVNTIISAASSFYILIYLFVLFAMLKYAFANAIKTNVFEKIMYSFAAVVLCIIFVYHYYDIINTALTNKDIESYVALGVEILFFVGVGCFICLTYFLYYKPRLAKRLKDHHQHQIDLDRQFRLMDGWAYLKGKFAYMNKRYSKKEIRRHKLAKHFSKYIKINNDNAEAKLA
jgi:predicted ferric reductase